MARNAASHTASSSPPSPLLSACQVCVFMCVCVCVCVWLREKRRNAQCGWKLKNTFHKWESAIRSQYSNVIAFLKLCVCVKVNLSAQRMCIYTVRLIYSTYLAVRKCVCGSIHRSCIRMRMYLYLCVNVSMSSRWQLGLVWPFKANTRYIPLINR